MKTIQQRSSHDVVNLMLLPNNICNFHCTYCYSAKGRSKKEASVDMMKTGIDYFFYMHKDDLLPLSISVAGGGEPLLSWNLLKQSLDYAYEIGHKYRKSLPTCLITNGSIWSEDITQYCIKHNIDLLISFDVLPNIQNKQRGHYDLVLENIKRYMSYGLNVSYSTVITKDNVHLMCEMVESIYRNTPNIRNALFKPIISSDYFENIEAFDAYYANYTKNFFSAQKLASDKGLYITSPLFNNSLVNTDRYCQGKFIITAEGAISICPFVSSKQDALYEQFIYGSINHGEVEINQQKLHELLSHNHDEDPKCKNCLAYWHCAGGCYVNNLSMKPEYKEIYCNHVRAFMNHAQVSRNN